jgi:hypothetical protein
MMWAPRGWRSRRQIRRLISLLERIRKFWNVWERPSGALPTKIQRELFQHATSLANLAQTVPPRGRIAGFLHNQKDYDDRTTKTMPRRPAT